MHEAGRFGQAANVYPKIFHCRRDPRDVAVSCWMTDFRSIRWSNHPDHIGSRFRQYLQLMVHWRAGLPVRIHEVDYEETVADLEGVAKRLVEACRPAVGPGLPRVPHDAAARPNRQHHAGSAPALQAVGRTVEEL